VVPPSLNITRFKEKPSFKKDVKRLDPKVIKDLERALHDLMGEVPPGRNFKKLKDSDVYTIRISLNYRLSFELDGDTAILRRVGPRQKFYDSY
jgi:mRNA-degrading endonuclease RelE of RelBE toxin-antitoxin system